MIVQGQCQHCAGIYEYEAGSKSELCPHCGKETLCFPTKPEKTESESKTKTKSSSSSNAILLDIGAVILLFIGCGLVFGGCNGEQAESQNPEGSAIRQTVYAVQYCSGFILIGLSLILAALVRMIRKP
jgi:hypothetical protein